MELDVRQAVAFNDASELLLAPRSRDVVDDKIDADEGVVEHCADIFEERGIFRMDAVSEVRGRAAEEP